MSGPPPPPPHGQNPKTTAGSGLPPGKFDIFIIPDHSSGGGFLYLPSLRPSVNSFAAGFATALVLVVVTQSLAPAFQAWWAQFSGIGNLGMMLLTIGLSVGTWVLGRIQAGGGGSNSNGWTGFEPAPGAGPGTFPNGPSSGYASPPPQPDPQGATPPPRTSSHGGPQSGGMPNGSWQQHPPQPEPADKEHMPEDDPTPEPQPSPQKKPEPKPEPEEPAPEPAKEMPPQKAPPKPEPEPDAQKNAWERAREETRRREEEKRKAEEERKKAEAEAKRKEEAQRRLKEMRARELKERQRREKERKEAAARAAAEEQARLEKEKRDQEEKERLVREKEQRERELAELKEAQRVEKERRERAERELNERLEKERKEKELRDQRAREIKERLEHEAREKERMEKIKREQEILERERQIREAREREQKEREEKERKEREAREAREKEAQRLKEEQENATRRSTYAYTSVGEKTSLWPNGKPTVAHPPAPASASGQSTPTRGPPSPTKRPPAPTARTDAGTEDAYSYRPYDKPKTHARRKSNSSYVSDASWAPSQSTSRTTPPPSTRSSRPPYSTNDPDKIVIRAVYGFLNSFAKTPASQLLSGMSPVTDGLILRITTEGIFIDDDVRKVPQREWDVKAWTLKQVEVWCACHSVVAAAAAAAVPSHLHKTTGPKPRPSERGTKTLNGPDADDYLKALRTTCENNCKVGVTPAGHEVSGPQLHVLRATLRDQEGKRYLFIIPEEESWKMAIGLQRLRASSQVRALGVAGMPRDEASNILSTLGF